MSVGSWIQRRARELEIDSPLLAKAANLPEARLRAIESDSEAPTFDELRGISRILGIDLATFDPDEGGAPEKLPSVTTLMKSAGRFIPPTQWRIVADAAEVAREIVTLEELLGRTSRFDRLCGRFSPDGRFGERIWEDGRRLAERVRNHTADSIPSMLKRCEELGIAVIETWLPQGISALCLVDRDHGPTIVINLAGHNESAFVRRFTLAHEICHILFDRHELEPLQKFDRYGEEYDKPDVEKRADAFAIHLLAPEGPFKSHWKQMERFLPVEAILRKLMERFGVGFQATRSHAIHLGLLLEEDGRRLSTVETAPTDSLVKSELDTTANELFAPIPRERRGSLLRLTLEALDRGLLGRSKALELLAVTGDAFDDRSDVWRSELGIGP
ncbi:MAG: ImmA/IrrE family metallo-endopeptidase [Minicystis sp.]